MRKNLKNRKIEKEKKRGDRRDSEFKVMMNCGTISFHYPGGIRKERSACN
jgi:hypothetical protein